MKTICKADKAFTNIEDFDSNVGSEVHVVAEYGDKLIGYELYDYDGRLISFDSKEDYFKYVKRTKWIKELLPSDHPYFEWVNKTEIDEDVINKEFVEHILTVFKNSAKIVQTISDVNKWLISPIELGGMICPNLLIHPEEIGIPVEMRNLGAIDDLKSIINYDLPVYDSIIVITDTDTLPFISDSYDGNITVLQYFFQITPDGKDISIINGNVIKTYPLRKHNLNEECWKYVPHAAYRNEVLKEKKEE